MFQNQDTCGQDGGCAALKQYEKRKRRRGIRVIGALLAICLLLGIVSMAGEAPAPNKPYIAVLEIAGTISENDGYTYDQQYLLDSVEQITADSYNQGLILHIDSPGGAVYQIDQLYLKLMDYKEQTGRPVYGAIESYAASGGYYEACAADKIYANRNAITGSIGVIMGEFVDLSGLLEQLGVDVDYITSGPNKSMGNSYQPLTAEQKAIYQSICDEYYNRFVQIVAAGRNMDEATVRKLADGRVYSASQAVKNGLIDGLESFDDTVARMKTDLQDESLAVQHFYYQAPSSLLDYLSSSNPIRQFFGRGQSKAVQEQQQPQILMYYGEWR